MNRKQLVEHLDQYYRQERENFSDRVRLRAHRAISWLKKAEAEEEDLDIGFISLWIAFNAIYANDTIHFQTADRNEMRNFIQSICDLNPDKTYDLIWKKYSSSIKALLKNRYLFQAFWDFHNEKITEVAWFEDFKAATERSNQALANQNTPLLLWIIFERIYTLRNQIFHGGATYNSLANRTQLQDAYNLLFDLNLLFIETLIEHPEHNWGKPFYPYISDVSISKWCQRCSLSL